MPHRCVALPNAQGMVCRGRPRTPIYLDHSTILRHCLLKILLAANSPAGGRSRRSNPRATRSLSREQCAPGRTRPAFHEPLASSGCASLKTPTTYCRSAAETWLTLNPTTLSGCVPAVVYQIIHRSIRAREKVPTHGITHTLYPTTPQPRARGENARTCKRQRESLVDCR